MKKVKGYIIMLVVMFGIMSTLRTSVRAEQSCSITVNTFNAQQTSIPIPGIQVTLFYIAGLSTDSSVRYVNTPEFIGFTGRLSWSSTSDCANLANQLSAYAEQQHIQGITQTTSEKGTTKFANLEKGLYLVVQSGKDSKDYKMFIPSLMEVPFYDSNEYIYDVNLYPKVEPKPTPTPTPTPKPTPTPTIPIPEPSTPGDLPSTGMLQWPIPVLAVSGCSCVLIGAAILLLSHKKGDSDEK